MSETKNGLLIKLSEIQASIEYLQKNTAGNQGAMYIDTPVLLKKVRDKMVEFKVLLIPNLKNSSVESIPAPTKNNKDAIGFIFKSEMVYTWMDAESNDILEVPWFITAKHMTDPAMAGGSALTYFERYFLLKFFQIPTAKDDPEYFKNKTKEPEPVKQITIGSENLNWLIGFCKRNNIIDKQIKEDFQDHYKFDPYGTTENEFNSIRGTIETDYSEAP